MADTKLPKKTSCMAQKYFEQSEEDLIKTPQEKIELEVVHISRLKQTFRVS